jgi:hypothetical protein
MKGHKARHVGHERDPGMYQNLACTDEAAQVDCLLATPLESSNAGGKLWTGSADGTLLAWPDPQVGWPLNPGLS